MEEVFIDTQLIQLDQLLKWIGVVESGGQVKLLLSDGLIELNGQVISERRKKIYPGDTVTVKGIGTWKVAVE